MTGTVLAGTAAGAAAAGYLVAPREVRLPVAAASATAIVLTGDDIDPSGDDDSTAGLQALIDAAPEGARLWLPAGVYAVDGVVLKPGQSLSGPSARRYTGVADAGARLRARLPTQTAPVLTIGELGRLSDIAVEGNARRQPAVRPAGIGAVLDRVTMVGGSVGFDAAYVSGSVLTACQIHENDIGIKDIVDSMVQACAVNANSGAGVSLGPGANDNTLVANKIEWNDGHGIDALQAVHNVVLGGVVDRNGKAGVHLVECAHSAVVSVVLRRNGRLSNSSPADDCHLYQENCTSLVVTGVATDEGRDDDDASGYRSPSVAIRDEGGTDIGYMGNDLTGRTSPVAIARGAQGTRPVQGLNLGVSGVQSVTGTRARAAAAQLSLAAGATDSATFDLSGTPGTDVGAVYRVSLVSRAEGSDARGAAEAFVLVSGPDRAPVVELSAVTNVIGTQFGTVDGAYLVSAAAAAYGGALAITVQNRQPTAVRVGIELT